MQVRRLRLAACWTAAWSAPTASAEFPSASATCGGGSRTTTHCADCTADTAAPVLGGSVRGMRRERFRDRRPSRRRILLQRRPVWARWGVLPVMLWP